MVSGLAEIGKERELHGVIKEILNYDTITILDISGTHFIDPPIDSIYSLEVEETIKILNSLTQEGYFKKEVSRMTYCKKCFTPNLLQEHVCPVCGSPRIKKGRIIAHKCGFEGFKEIFVYGNELRCPKCHKKLYAEGKDYFDKGVKYKCLACGNVFEKPAVSYRCRNCGARYNKPPEMVFVSYKRMNGLQYNSS